ncbi:UNVERIFIED_CONTAM: hypothetical protein GTU68_007164 [Idotea baltica]|nr:hypothetical protein [Idotea baltica]
MELLQTIFYTLVALGVLVTIHEFGHFWVARRCGIRVIRFSVGFGTPLLRWKDKKNTEFVIAALPLGGYVKMVDEREGNVSEEDLPFAFTQKSVWQRMAVVAAGPLANFLLAIVLYWGVFLQGVTGIVPVTDEVVSGDPADLAGLLPGDIVSSADGMSMPDWTTWVEYVRARPGQLINIEVARNDRSFETVITPKQVLADDGEKIGQVGMTVKIPEWPEGTIHKVEYSLMGAGVHALEHTWNTSVLILSSVKKMLVGLISAKHLSGPITIAKVAGASAQYGLTAYLSFLAFLSVSLGILNLLPVPVLDGGHLMYYIVEVIKGSPVSEKIQMAGFKVGTFLIIGLMVLALYNDVMRL